MIKNIKTIRRLHRVTPDSSTVPRYILVRENMPVRGLGVDSTRRKCEGLWNRVSKSWQNSNLVPRACPFAG